MDSRRNETIIYLFYLQLRSLMEGLIPLTIYTDATPHSVAALIPTLKLTFAQAFHVLDEINRDEAMAVLCRVLRLPLYCLLC